MTVRLDGSVRRVDGVVARGFVCVPEPSPTGICGTVVFCCGPLLLPLLETNTMTSTTAAIAISPTRTGTSHRLLPLSDVNACLLYKRCV